MEWFDEALSRDLTCRYFAAKGLLLAEMRRQGLLEEEGWRVAEETRIVDSWSEIVFRPVHSDLPSPFGFECVACIDEFGEDCPFDCDPDDDFEPLTD